MKSNEELRALYEKVLKPELVEIEHQRKRIKRMVILGIIGAIGVFIVQGSMMTGAVPIIIALVIGIIAIGIMVFLKFTEYRKVFKNEVVTKVINLINPDYYYNSDKRIDDRLYRESKLFTKDYDRIKGDDYVSGVIDKTKFEFSELKVEYKTESVSDGNRKTEWHTIFQGLFFHADFNKHIEGVTYVLPDTAEKLFGKFGQKLQKASSRGDLVKLENPEFEKEYVVYSTGQQEARYILTPTMMEALVNIKKSYKRKIHFSFIGERVYCAVSFSKGLFEPRIFKSGINYADIEEMYQLFGLIETIIHEMNLNTRIWTKE